MLGLLFSQCIEKDEHDKRRIQATVSLVPATAASFLDQILSYCSIVDLLELSVARRQAVDPSKNWPEPTPSQAPPKRAKHITHEKDRMDVGRLDWSTGDSVSQTGCRAKRITDDWHVGSMESLQGLT